MSALLGLALGAGVLLVASHWLWPRGHRMPRQSALVALWSDRLAQAGLERVTPGMLGAVSVVMGVAAASVAYALVPVAVLAVAAGVAVLALPAVLVSWRARRERRAARVAWPDLVDHLVSAVRAGVALPDGVAGLASVGPECTRAAFAEFAASYRVTGNFGVCLDELKERLADPVADRILETLRMAREVGGGELTAILRALGANLREESATRSELEARQSWVLMAARLGVAAPWIVLALLSTRAEAAVAYGSPAGVMLVVTGLVVSLVAYRLMLAVGRLPEERRWFG
ncbi:MAG: type II secretion system F family protein [Actinobacteria bacterium]|nr:type II secretion system F family protein [Actinomycetota bacterium]